MTNYKKRFDHEMAYINLENGEPGQGLGIRWMDSMDSVLRSSDTVCTSEVGGNMTHEQSTDSDGDTISSESPSVVPQIPLDRPHQDVWNPQDIQTTLQNLAGFEDLSILLSSGHLSELTEHTNAHTTGLLLAAWTGNYSAAKCLIDDGANVNVIDREGRSPLHLSSCIGDDRIVELLLQNGAPGHQWDRTHSATPLHCAASSGSLRCVQLLIGAGAHVNAGLKGRSALHYAVQSGATDCVRELLENGACPNPPQVFTETPLHVAASLGSAECTRLLLQHGADLRSQWGSRKITALHLAAEDGNAECAKLLIDAGAQIDALNHRKQTPLHLASLAQSAETLELLLSRGADCNAIDCDGRTPLHGAIVKESRSCDCVRILLDSGAHVNRADNFGYTPLHIAALNEFSSCVYLLIGYGGDVTARTKGGVSALSFIVRRTPDVIPKYVAKFDSSIKVNDHEIGDVDCELKLDFRILVPCVDRGETELLLAFIEVGRKEILKHPLCETFLFLKWRRIRKFFLLSLLYHAFFVLVFSVYVVGVFLRESVSPNWAAPLGYVILNLNAVLLGKELFQMGHGWTGYSRHWENWLQWTIIITVFLCVTPWQHLVGHASWQHHVAATSILLAWLELMMLVGRFPVFGLYVQMFTTVAVNFSKFLLAYCCLLVAFALSFSVLFANYPAFKSIQWALLKAVVMMSGELEFEDIFYDDQYPIRYPVTAHLIFLAFIVLVTVILTNLLVGLAVSDIQGLQQTAGLDRLSRQAELVARLESVLFSKFLRKLPLRILIICHRSALLLTSSGQWALYVRPNDPREKRIPRELITSIYRLVAERKERPQSKRQRKYPTNTGRIINSTSNCDMSKQHSYTSLPTSKDPRLELFMNNENKKLPTWGQHLGPGRVRVRTCSDNPNDNFRNIYELYEGISEVKMQMADICDKIERFNASVHDKFENVSKEIKEMKIRNRIFLPKRMSNIE